MQSQTILSEPYYRPCDFVLVRSLGGCCRDPGNLYKAEERGLGRSARDWRIAGYDGSDAGMIVPPGYC